MDFGFSSEQEEIRREIRALCARFDDDYWRQHDKGHTYPEEFYRAMADGGWLGIAMPERYGGAGKGITEAALVMHEVAASGACDSGCSATHLNIFGVHPLVVHGTEAQRQAYLPPIVHGEHKVCFGVTEPDTGLDTTHLRTRAERHGDHFIVNGKKIWITTAQRAHKILLLARTTPLDGVKKATDGLTLFYTDMDRAHIDVRGIDKCGGGASDSNELFIDNLRIPAEHIVGEEGRGFYYLLDGLNPERILLAAESVGIGKIALAKAAQYAKERVVFDRPIGMNQAVQHPLADSWARLAAIELLVFKAAWLYDQGLPCGTEANAAKYLAAEAGFQAADRAMQVLGGMGYSREFHVERYWREAKLYRIAPVSPELILCYLAERALGLPKSY
ncbi:MAG: acyl-CoA/acyl-ACP dehydrogenase [Candidatus Lambdaproteobacteria bacterium]|nr:acyl-CoA/acyl-ACP dehydrogenase [Candidatus Lambdaproteobacteria bacterium]